MHLDVFAEGNSPLHRVDPRAKFLAFAPLVCIVAAAKGIHCPLYALFVACALAVLARLDARVLLERMLIINAFIVPLWIFLPIGTQGCPIIVAGPIVVTSEGVSLALAITLKTNAITLITVAVLGTSEVLALTHALLHLRCPVKLVYLFFFCYRYIALMHEEYQRLCRAITIRAFRPKTNLHTYKTYAYVVGMLLVRSHERSQRIYQAMLCRGFTGKFPLLQHFYLKASDYLFLAIMTLVSVSMLLV
ncbi:cobalt ABC transporter permease CbiQ [Candidatus Magnetobacterium bavaricum]|uniref:Cobalt ABC transporter permease CbiQ n=1 Tax=Candidatus Magnetobacterium bavaricum TaxID=29290 RepID=A0A0F3GZ19_9BACT|nr:cobalt ABC transporter permease CbiQ [Candidatus Magnetobacterium bavaricum]